MRKELRVIVAGSRNFSDYDLLADELNHLFDSYKDFDLTIISGVARGADSLGERYASENGLKLVRFPAQWEKYGKRAGYIRNEEMLRFASETEALLVAFWDGESKGTRHMISLASKENIQKKIILQKQRKDT